MFISNVYDYKDFDYKTWHDGRHRHCGMGDIKFLVCYVISQDYVTKR